MPTTCGPSRSGEQLGLSHRKRSKPGRRATGRKNQGSRGAAQTQGPGKGRSRPLGAPWPAHSRSWAPRPPSRGMPNTALSWPAWRRLLGPRRKGKPVLASIVGREVARCSRGPLRACFEAWRQASSRRCGSRRAQTLQGGAKSRRPFCSWPTPRSGCIVRPPPRRRGRGRAKRPRRTGRCARAWRRRCASWTAGKKRPGLEAGRGRWCGRPGFWSCGCSTRCARTRRRGPTRRGSRAPTRPAPSSSSGPVTPSCFRPTSRPRARAGRLAVSATWWLAPWTGPSRRPQTRRLWRSTMVVVAWTLSCGAWLPTSQWPHTGGSASPGQRAESSVRGSRRGRRLSVRLAWLGTRRRPLARRPLGPLGPLGTIRTGQRAPSGEKGWRWGSCRRGSATAPWGACFWGWSASWTAPSSALGCFTSGAFRGG
mmetsp:Transcript_41594/g.93837  ORF Transcript_41594/g.93837 Transcript_41594/m.93837 type:complete len:424 (+) Transcript_41594:78-1349(+)